MLEATTVTDLSELRQVNELNKKNLKQHLPASEQVSQGFVTWYYPMALLKEMHRLAASIIVKDGEKLAGYALATLKESSAFHPDLQKMFKNLEQVSYNNKPLFSYDFYCMGQICIAKEYRGCGLVKLLYDKHREVYGQHFDFILTEISTSNYRSMKAHENIGFKTIYTYRDEVDEWVLVVWDWI